MKSIKTILQGHVKDAVYAANDGAVTTFAVVAGVVGASLGKPELLILGFASLFADGFSMAVGNFLGTRSESDQYAHEIETMKKEFSGDGRLAQEDANRFLKEKGFSDQDAEQLSVVMVKNKPFFLDIMISHRLGISDSNTKDALRSAVITFLSFLSAGIIPLLPYIFLSSQDTSSNFVWACVFTGVALFGIGALRTLYSDKKWWSGGFEMLLVGGVAAIIAYAAGYAIQGIV